MDEANMLGCGLGETLTVHKQYSWLCRLPGGVYDYDPADDGPECEIVTRILAQHPLYVAGVEKRAIRYSRLLDCAALVLFQHPFADIGEDARMFIRNRVAQTLARWGFA